MQSFDGDPQDLHRIMEENTVPMPEGYTQLGLVLQNGKLPTIAIWGPDVPSMKFTGGGWKRIDDVRAMQ